MSRRLGIIGAGGHGKVVADTAERAGWSKVVFFDPRFGLSEQTHAHWPLLGFPEDAQTHECDGYFVAIGNSQARQQWCEWLLDRRLPVASVIDPASTVSQYAMLESGVLVVAGAVINADAHIAQDCTIGAYSHVCPGSALAGTVAVGEHSWLGIGCQVRQGVSIGSNVMVGAGATVVSDIQDGLTVVGTPARPQKFL